MDVANRAAEHGSKIITSGTHEFTDGKLPIAARALVDTSITTIVSDNCEGIEFYNGTTLSPSDPIILANINSITIASGGLQLIYS